MIMPALDSRVGLGSDLVRRPPSRYEYEETSALGQACMVPRSVRVVQGKVGGVVRLSAPDLDIVVDGATIEIAWGAFLAAIRDHDDTAWVTFDVGPIRPAEMASALDAPDVEDWAEPTDDSGAAPDGP